MTRSTKPFIVYVTALNVDSGDEMHHLKKAKIEYLKVDKAYIEVPHKYVDFVDVFSPKLVTKFPKHRINNYVIELINDWQPPYNSIYSLGPVKLEILKAYIKNNQVNSFYRPSKSPVGAFIFFIKKLDSSLRLCGNYQGLNNLTIKNEYPLSLIREPLLDRFCWT